MIDKAIPIFSIPMYVSEKNYDLNENERSFIIELSKHTDMNSGSNFSTVREKYNYVLQNFSVFSELKKFINNEITIFTEKVMKIKNEKLGITQSWFNYNNKKESHHHHNHRNSVFSGIFYAKSTELTPTIFTRNDYFFDNWQVEYTEKNTYNATEFVLALEPGKLVLFPSQLYHFVPENLTDTTRVTLAFNTFWKTKIGDNNKLTELDFSKINNE